VVGGGLRPSGSVKLLMSKMHVARRPRAMRAEGRWSTGCRLALPL
jgi:hypothetical protein